MRAAIAKGRRTLSAVGFSLHPGVVSDECMDDAALPGKMSDDAAARQRTAAGGPASRSPLPPSNEHRPPSHGEDEPNVVVGVLKQQIWKQGEDISRVKAEAEQQARMYGEELRMLDDERNTTEAAAAHENHMLRLELTRLREETRACRHAKRQSAELSQARWEAEDRLHELEAHAEEHTQHMQRKLHDLQARLETQYRTQLRKVRDEYRAEALSEVGEEARVALAEWTALRNEAEEQRSVISAGLRQHGGLRQKLGEKARELELQRHANGMQSAKAAMYRRQLTQLGEAADRAQKEVAAVGQQRAEATAVLRAEVAPACWKRHPRCATARPTRHLSLLGPTLPGPGHATGPAGYARDAPRSLGETVLSRRA